MLPHLYQALLPGRAPRPAPAWQTLDAPSLSLLLLVQAGRLMPDFSGTSMAQECFEHFQQLSPGAEASPVLQEMLLEQGWVELHYSR